MNWLGLLNPIRWFKSAAYSAVESKVDEVVTVENGKSLVIAGVNKAVTLSENKWSDDECRTYARAFMLAGKAFTDLGEAVDPDGEDGRKMSVAEFNLLLGDAQAAFGIIVDEAWMAKQRERIKAHIRYCLGM